MVKAAAMATAAALFVAAFLAASDAAATRPRFRRLARILSLVGAFSLLPLLARPAARPFAAFAVVAALAGPQPLPLTLAAGSAAVAALVPPAPTGSSALVLAGAAAAFMAHALGRSGSDRLAPGGGALAAPIGALSSAVPSFWAERRYGDLLDDEQSALVLSRLAVVLAIGATLAAGVEGWLRAGTYLTATTQRLLSAALVALAASETTRARAAARALALAALLAVLVR